MNEASPGPGSELAYKIARLVEEKGWNQEDFARITRLNRHTVHQILHGGRKRQLRNITISKCAKGLNLTVSELRHLPLERLIPRMHGKPPVDDDTLKILYERATLPELIAWLDRNRDRASELTADEVHELLDMQAPGGPLERLGVEHCVELLERRRHVINRVKDIARTEYFEFLEKLVQLIHEKVKPPPRRV
ncbi:MAG: helix-turn-helix transcriptional regulator [Gemmataceae bacterium]|nr:helix-turn-helix transcriptional regulator [Gemmata sp.]MDW8196690.1 helix-turn-helix transcriptional regulator [Gemmataceae bacterium]